MPVAGMAVGRPPPVDTGLERLRRFAGVVPQAVPLVQQIQRGVERGYEPLAGTFPALEKPAISAFQRQLAGEVTPREEAAFIRPVLERFRTETGRLADEGLATGRRYLPGEAAIAAGGVPSQELATGLGEAAVGMERLRGEREAGALRTLRGFMPQVTAGREAFGLGVGEAGREIPGADTGAALAPPIAPRRASFPIGPRYATRSPTAPGSYSVYGRR